VPRARLGVVLALPAPAAAEIEGLRRALGRGREDRIAPHVTLVPPVNVAPGDFPTVLDLVRDAAAGTPPLRLVLGPPASFWPATPVVYLDVGGDIDGVRHLRDALDGGPLVRPTTWPFVPHVTIAPDVDPDLIPDALSVLSSYRREVTVTTMRLLREEPDRTWSGVADVSLSGRRVVARGGLEVVLEQGETLDREAEHRLAGAWAIGTDRDGLRPLALVARREGAIVGAAAGRTDDELWLGRLAVDPAVRGQGIGRHLLRAVEATGAERGCARAFAVVAFASPVRTWLAAHGWREDIDLPGWRHGERFIRLTRHLAAST
jgi:2'-5' RNA ligase